MWHLKPFSSRHCFSHIWQYQRSFWSPLDLMLFEIHFGVPNSAFPILIILCFYSLITSVLKKFSFSKRFFINYLRIWKFHDENFRFVIFLWFSLVFTFCCCFAIARVIQHIGTKVANYYKNKPLNCCVSNNDLEALCKQKRPLFSTRLPLKQQHAALALKLKCLQYLNPGRLKRLMKPE